MFTRNFIITGTLLALLITAPLAAHAQQGHTDAAVIIEEIESTDAPDPNAAPKPADAAAKPAAAEEVMVTEEVAVVEEVTFLRAAPDFRDGRFRVGLVAPGIYYGNKGIDAMMTMGAEGEYFFFEQLSAGLGISVATDFQSNAKPNAILNFVPKVRYFFDFTRYPRISAYVQAGVGLALIDGKHAAADIMIPGGGITWRWKDHWYLGLDTALHVLARSSTAVSFQFSPTLRYQF